MIDNRSGCPINLTMEILGDRWSLVVLRDVAIRLPTKSGRLSPV